MNENLCRYYNSDLKSCMGEKYAPPTDCEGNVEKYHCVLPENYKYNKPQKDMVNHPSHYNNGGIECIDGLAAAVTGLTGMEAFCTANAIKYLWRWKWKNGKEDLDKAIFYINWLKEHLDDIN